MKTHAEILKLSTEYLAKHRISSPRREAEELLCDALGIERIALYTQFDRPLAEKELQTCRDRLARRIKGEPRQYIHGEVEFYGCRIKVTPAVLIPRQETEILVDKVYKELSTKVLEDSLAGSSALVDLCCGSGCIGIALKKKFPSLKVILSDISAEALAVAKENAALNEVSVEFLQGDLCKPLEGCKAQFVICNPPYISEGEFMQLDREVRDFEPRTALVGGKSGLEFYERLSKELLGIMAPGGKVWFEIGMGQGGAIKELFEISGWKNCKVEHDWGNRDRFFLAALS